MSPKILLNVSGFSMKADTTKSTHVTFPGTEVVTFRVDCDS